MKKTNNLSIRIHINEIENSIAFKINTEWYVELLMAETIKLLGNTQR